MHRFDGLDLLCLLVGLSLLCYVAWRLWCLHVSRGDTEQAEEIPGQRKYWAGVDLGNEHHGFSIYDSWEQKWVEPPNKGKSRTDAQMMLYQYMIDPHEPTIYIGTEDQAAIVFEEAGKFHNEVMRAWLNTREPGQQIPSMAPPGPVRFIGTAPVPDYRDSLWHARGPVPDVYRLYNWADDPDA